MKGKSIHDIVCEMCLLWSISPDNRVKTLRHFAKICTDPKTASLTAINPEHLMLLYRHIRTNSQGTDKSVKRMFSYVTRVFDYAFSKGYIPQNPAALIKLPKSRKSRPHHLKTKQLQKLENLTGLSEPLERARDMFLFACYSGLSYKDLKYFGEENLVTINGQRYGTGLRGKTSEEYIFHVTPKLEALLAKYGAKLPVSCAQRFNINLKQLQKLAGIKTKRKGGLTVHFGRRGYGQSLLDSGLPIEVVSRSLGHSSIKTTEEYYVNTKTRMFVREIERKAA